MGLALLLREYERAAIGDRWDPEVRVVPTHVVASLEALQSDQASEIFRVERRAIQAQQWVGTVGFGDYALELLPKIDRADALGVRRNLMSMLEVGGLVPHLESGETQIAGAGETLLDAYLALFVRRLAREWRRGPIRDYRREERERKYLRGKLLVSEQLRASLRRPHHFVTSADELTNDAPLSRLLKAALVICHRYALSHDLRQEARALLGEFAEVAEVSAGESVAGVELDRRHARFESLAELARLLVGFRSPDRPGSASTFSLVFDMNVVFERFIAAHVARICVSLGMRASSQESGRSLLLHNGKKRFALRPDIAIYVRGELRCLIDTKWKRLDPSASHAGVIQADMYQMYAYGKEYRCPRVVLLYPRHGALSAHVATYRHTPGEIDSPIIEVRTVDVSADRQSVLAELESLLMNEGDTIAGT